MTGKLLYKLFSWIFCISILVLTWNDAKKTLGIVGSIGVFVAVLAAFGVLFALDRYLKKTKSEQWMSRYYICLALVFGLAILVVMVLVLRAE